MDVKAIVETCHLFVDTCSLMNQNASNFFYRLEPILLELKKQIVIPHKVIMEINHHQNSSESDTKQKARKGYEILKEYMGHNLIDIRGEANDPFADNVFHYVFSKFRTQHHLALLTQDRGLAMDVLSLKTSLAIESKKRLVVLRLDGNGNISEWKNGNSYGPPRKSPTVSTPFELKKFRQCSQPRAQGNRILEIGTLPGENDTIEVDEFGAVRLKQLLGKGGEGTIFLTDSGHTCKIYHKDRLTEFRLQKLTLMTGKKVQIPGVCWPLAIARNSERDFVGYLMPTAVGKPMQKCMFVKPLLEKHFPYWTRHHLVQLAITWLEKVAALHSLNVLIGDINPLNFLVKSEHEVFFVDTDSYQIEDFPCPVGMANFTAPEIQGKDFSTFLRTQENEWFAVATLLFMVLLPGKPPYSHQGGGDPITNIKEGEFSYPLGDKSNKKAPEGPWRFIWSHLPYKTKEAFHACFVQHKRKRPEEWLTFMKGYMVALEQGHLDPDGESDKIFPTRHKAVTDYAKKKFNARSHDLETFICDICGKTFQLNGFHAARIRDLPTKRCSDCLQVRKIEHENGELLICSECGKHFLFSIGEQGYYRARGLVPPKRCEECRGNSYAAKTPSRFPRYGTQSKAYSIPASKRDRRGLPSFGPGSFPNDWTNVPFLKALTGFCKTLAGFFRSFNIFRLFMRL